MHTTEEELRQLERCWIEAEIKADAAELDALAIGDFTLIGPAGFVLGKEQWLERYRSGDLRTHSLRLEDTTTRVYGAAAVTIGRHVQQAEYRGQAVNGEFRATHIAIRDGSRWRLAGLHLSPIGGPSPFAAGNSGGDDAR